MILTTTPTVEGRTITQYHGIVFGEVISGVNVLKDFTAGLSNFFGGRSNTYEEELMNARTQALSWSSGLSGWGPTLWWASTWTTRCWAATTACSWSPSPVLPFR